MKYNTINKIFVFSLNACNSAFNTNNQSKPQNSKMGFMF